MKQSACIEMLFPDEPDLARRVVRAREAGFDAVEFWRWQNKDLRKLEAVCRGEGIGVAGFLTEPKSDLADPARRADFLDGLARSAEEASRLGAGLLYTQSGHPVAGMTEDAMTDEICASLDAAADVLRDTGVTLLLEPVSDNPGCILDTNPPGFEIIARVGRPEVRMLYDVYHAAVQGEDWRPALPQLSLCGHIHIADHPGRGAPGTGGVDIEGFLAAVKAAGYEGMIGHEYRGDGMPVRLPGDAQLPRGDGYAKSRRHE